MPFSKKDMDIRFTSSLHLCTLHQQKSEALTAMEGEETHRLLPHTAGSGSGGGITSRCVYTEEPTKTCLLVKK